MAETWLRRITRYLEAQGFVPDHTLPQSRKYLKYRKHNEPLWYYLGSNGAVWISHQGTRKTAISMTDMVKHNVCRWEQTPDGQKGLHNG